MSCWPEYSAPELYGPHGFPNIMDHHIYPNDELDLSSFDSTWDLDSNIDLSLRNLSSSSGLCLDAREPFQRWYAEPQHILFTPYLDQQLTHLDCNKTEIIGTLPYPCREPLRSSCSSIQDAPSPATAVGSPPSPQYGMSNNSPLFINRVTRGFGDFSSPLVPICANIDPKDVQTFADEPDEGFVDMPMKDYNAEANSQTIKQEACQGGHYSQERDEGFGGSVRSEGGSPPSKPIKIDDGDTDADADGEDVEDESTEMDILIAEDEDEDGTYSPKSGRRKSRRATRTSPTRPANKNNRVNKSNSSSKSKFTCKTCGHVAKDTSTLTKHIAGAHTRPYVCAFAFAGCGATFGNKNEWKRHVYSQHLSLQYWLCNVGQCAATKPKSRGTLSGNEFNRKDLFTQHLRRMHAPFSVKQQKRTSAEWEERVKDLQAQCLKTRRQPPNICKCPVPVCAQIFQGPTSWDDRMEHVGRHLERTSAATATSLPAASAAVNGNMEKDLVDQESDEYMLEWCLAENIIERKNGGGYKLCLDAGGESSAPEENDDAEGEDE